jgi:predicted transcriptional regulator
MTLQEYLTEKNLKPSTFANSADIAPSIIIRILSGERKPSLATMQRIMVATDGKVTPNDYIEGRANETDTAA